MREVAEEQQRRPRRSVTDANWHRRAPPSGAYSMIVSLWPAALCGRWLKSGNDDQAEPSQTPNDIDAHRQVARTLRRPHTAPRAKIHQPRTPRTVTDANWHRRAPPSGAGWRSLSEAGGAVREVVKSGNDDQDEPSQTPNDIDAHRQVARTLRWPHTAPRAKIHQPANPSNCHGRQLASTRTAKWRHATEPNWHRRAPPSGAYWRSLSRAEDRHSAGCRRAATTTTPKRHRRQTTSTRTAKWREPSPACIRPPEPRSTGRCPLEPSQKPTGIDTHRQVARTGRRFSGAGLGLAPFWLTLLV